MQQSQIDRYITGEITGKFTGPFTGSFGHRSYYQMNLYKARLLNTIELKEPYDFLSYGERSFRCETLSVRIYENATTYTEETLYNVWIQEIEISKTSVVGNKIYGDIHGVLFGTIPQESVEIIPEEEEEEEFEIEILDTTNRPVPDVNWPAQHRRRPEISTIETNRPWRWWQTRNSNSNDGCFGGFGCFGCLGDLFGYLFVILLIFSLIRACEGVAVSLPDTNNSEEGYIETEGTPLPFPEEEDNSSTDTGTIDEEDCSIAITNHEWRDYSGNIYKGSFPYCNNLLKRSTQVRALQNISDFAVEYSNIINNDRSGLEETINEYKRIAREKQLTKKQLADMVVSSVQTMEYWLVHQGDHDVIRNGSQQYYEEFCQTNRCLDHIDHFGVLSPLEFLKIGKGDCDSRTVYLYIILNSLGVDTHILNSNTHSIVAVGGIKPDDGNYVQVRGKRYYVWETTAPGWKLGQFPEGSGEPLRNFKPVPIRINQI